MDVIRDSKLPISSSLNLELKIEVTDLSTAFGFSSCSSLTLVWKRQADVRYCMKCTDMVYTRA